MEAVQVFGDNNFFVDIKLFGDVSVNGSAIQLKCYENPDCKKPIDASYSWLKVTNSRKIEGKIENNHRIYRTKISDIGYFVHCVVKAGEEKSTVVYGPIKPSKQLQEMVKNPEILFYEVNLEGSIRSLMLKIGQDSFWISDPSKETCVLKFPYEARDKFEIKAIKEKPSISFERLQKSPPKDNGKDDSDSVSSNASSFLDSSKTALTRKVLLNFPSVKDRDEVFFVISYFLTRHPNPHSNILTPSTKQNLREATNHEMCQFLPENVSPACLSPQKTEMTPNGLYKFGDLSQKRLKNSQASDKEKFAKCYSELMKMNSGNKENKILSFQSVLSPPITPVKILDSIKSKKVQGPSGSQTQNQGLDDLKKAFALKISGINRGLSAPKLSTQQQKSQSTSKQVELKGLARLQTSPKALFGKSGRGQSPFYQEPSFCSQKSQWDFKSNKEMGFELPQDEGSLGGKNEHPKRYQEFHGSNASDEGIEALKAKNESKIHQEKNSRLLGDLMNQNEKVQKESKTQEEKLEGVFCNKKKEPLQAENQKEELLEWDSASRELPHVLAESFLAPVPTQPDLAEKNSEMDDTISRYQEKIKALLAELKQKDELLFQSSKLTSRNSNCGESCCSEELGLRISSLESKLFQKEIENNKLQIELKGQIKKAKELAEENEREKEERSKMAKELRERADESEKRKKEVEREMEGKIEESEKRMKEMEDGEKEKDKVKRRLEDALGELEKEKRDIRELRNAFHAVQNQLEKAQKEIEKTKMEMEMGLSQKEVELENGKTELLKAQRELENQRTELNEARKELEKKELLLKELSQSVKRATKEKEEAETQTTQALNQLKDSGNQMNEELEKSIRKQEALHEQKEKVLKELEELKEKYNVEKSTSWNQMKELQRKLEESKEKTKETQRKLEEAMRQLDESWTHQNSQRGLEISKQQKEMEEEMKQREKEMEERTREIEDQFKRALESQEESKREKSKLEMKLKESQDQKEEVLNDLRKQKRHLEEVNKQLKETQEHLEESKRQEAQRIQDSKERATDHSKILEQVIILKKQLRDSQKELNEAKIGLKEAQVHLEETRGQLSESRREEGETRIRLDETTGQLKQTQEKAKHISKELEEMRSQSRDLKGNLGQSEKEKQEIRKELQRIQSQGCQEQSEEAMKLREDLKEAKKALENTKEAFKREIRELKTNMAGLIHEKNQTEKANERISKEKKQLEKEMSEKELRMSLIEEKVKKETESLYEKFHEQEETIGELKKKLKETSMENEEKRELEEAVQEKEKELKEMERILRERETEKEGVGIENKRLSQEMVSLENRIQEKDETIKELEMKNLILAKSTEKELCRQAEELKETQKEIQKKEQKLVEMSQEMEKSKLEKESLLETLAEMKGKEKEKGASSKVEELEGKVAQARQEKEKLEEELTAYQNYLTDLEGEKEKLKKEMEEANGICGEMESVVEKMKENQIFSKFFNEKTKQKEQKGTMEKMTLFMEALVGWNEVVEQKEKESIRAKEEVLTKVKEQFMKNQEEKREMEIELKLRKKEAEQLKRKINEENQKNQMKLEKMRATNEMLINSKGNEVSKGLQREIEDLEDRITELENELSESNCMRENLSIEKDQLLVEMSKLIASQQN